MRNQRIILNVVVAIVLGVLLIRIMWRAGPDPVDETTPPEPMAAVEHESPVDPLDPAALSDPTDPGEPTIPALPAPLEGYDDGFDLEAHLARVTQIDPEDGFDMDLHIAALEQVGTAHLSQVEKAAQAEQAITDYEQAERRSEPLRAELADAIDDLLAQIEAQREIQQTRFAADDEWLQRNAEAAAADETLREIRLQTHERFRAMRDAEDGSEDAGQLQQALQIEMDRLREAAARARLHREAVEKREAELVDANPDARQAAQAIVDLQVRIDQKEAELKALFAEDENWQALRAEHDIADARREHANERLQAVIRARMRAEYDLARNRGDAGEQPRDNVPVPAPAD